ncbi:FHA domain-containing protein [Kribbella sp. NPDC056951]|uniref:FHA domain-containing protein n=1 Tax=Kribbella sp. NPDC056951 TaxID=3345978 RepID=UPI00363CAD59
METEFALSLGTQRWPLPSTATEITLGRAANADVRLPADDQISRIHARLVRTGAAWALHDASRNGTGLNGRRLTAPTALTNNDQIHIGRSVLTFHATPAAASPEPSQPSAPTSPASPQPSAPAASPAPQQPSAPATSAAAPPPPAAPAATPQPPATAASGTPQPSAAAPLGTPPAPAATPQRPASDAPATPASPEAESTGARSSTPSGAPDGQAAHGQPGAPNTPPTHQPPAGSAPAAPEPNRWSEPDDSGFLNPASTTPPPPAPPRPLTPRPAPTRAPADPPVSDDSAPAGSPFAPNTPQQPDAAPRNDPYPADRASISQPNPADAGNSASWPGYPSADYLESARSPLSGGDRAQIAQPDTPRNPYPARPDYPDYPDEPRNTRPTPRPANRPERRTSESVEVGQVRLARVLAIAGAMLAVGLVINLIATFLADGPGGLLRWLIAPTLALLGAMTFAILDAVSPTEREPSRLDVSVIVAIIAVLLGVGVGGFAITSGAEYAAGYLTGNESGEDRLIKPVGKTTAGLTITVDNVTNTSHFTRIRLTVNNKGKDSVSLPLDGNATFTSAEGNSIRADGSRSNWPDEFAAGESTQGTIVFKGHLPKGQKTAVLTLRAGDPAIVISSIPLTN